MFTTPIKRSPLTNFEELIKFSYQTEFRNDISRCYWQNNGQIAFSDDYGIVYVTPYRSEIRLMLEDAGYQEYALYVPFSNGEVVPESYAWLRKIAEAENWAATHEKAYAVSQEKGIKPVKIAGKYQLKEVSYYDDKENCTLYSALTMMWLHNESKDNIGTYIVIDDKTLVICDEYGRTWLLKVKTVINDIVNSLMDAGYKRTANPERYVKKYDPPVEPIVEPIVKPSADPPVEEK
ncbi:MAG: hypothetical protein IJN50_07560 [Clostridia bacterium]|nr:hypothetical protein [Clostridia bacterium]